LTKEDEMKAEARNFSFRLHSLSFAMILTRSQRDQLFEQARRDAPNETCGMIGGRNGRALKIYPIENIAQNCVTNYLMHGEAQLAAMQDMDANEYDIAAIYHSHPITPAYPSPTDVRDAFDAQMQEPLYPGTLYVIITLMNPEQPEMYAYHLDGKKITNVVLEILPD
jgi:[CysO sulfur-carrier protein]-S-L-cysteine hydrolase